MICVGIVQESRRLALADMLNAAQLGADLVEVRLDKFEKDANLGEIVAAKRTPVLFSCRRPIEGGEWAGADDERLILLRSAVMAKADYVELTIDDAAQVRPFPGCRRVVSYTNLHEVPANIDALQAKMQEAYPDVVRITCPTPTVESAWPLLKLLSNPPVPTVIVGIGAAGPMLALVGRKIGAPWVTAAIEKGMEAYAGQPTIRDLVERYRYRDIGKKTRFVGVTGEGELASIAAGLLNAAFAHLEMPHRALPVPVGLRKPFQKIADALRLQSVFCTDEFEGWHEIAALDESARSPVIGADGLLPVEAGWAGFNALGDAAATAIESVLADRGDGTLKGRTVLLAGCGTETRMLAAALKERGASIIWASRDRATVQATSQTFGGRQVLWEAIYNTSHDVLVVGRTDDPNELPVHPGYLKPGMVVLDLTAGITSSPMMNEAAGRRTGVVPAGRLLVERVREHVKRLGGEVPSSVLLGKLVDWMPEN